MKLKPYLIAGVFVLSILTVAFTVARVGTVQSRQGFTMHVTITDYPFNAGPIVSATMVRYHKADGNWKLETRYPNGRVDVGFGQVGRGVFHVNEQKHKLDYLSGLTGQTRGEAKLRSMPGFVGEETLLGFKTLHFHQVSDITGEVTDTYLCPSLQDGPMKIVSTFRNGGKRVYEVTRVVLGDPPQEVFASLPNYSVDMEHYNQVHSLAVRNR
jgi:hypothetical protein